MNLGISARCCQKARVVVISPLGGDYRELLLIGTNTASSATSGTKGASFTFQPQQGKETMIIALAVRKEAKPYHEWIGSIIQITWPENGKLVAECQEQWIPTENRLPQIVDRHLEITIDGERYSSLEGSPLFVDGNMLCAYAAGDIDSDAVKAVVKQRQEEASRADLLLKQVQALEAELPKLRATRDTAQRLTTEAERTSQRFGSLLRQTEKLADALSDAWWIGKAGREALQQWREWMKPGTMQNESPEN